jgi:hypothetical protein
MATRTNLTPGVQVAQLDGRARYHLTHKTPHRETLDDLRAVCTDAEIIRQAAESARASYLADPALRFQDGDVARLLDELL